MEDVELQRILRGLARFLGTRERSSREVLRRLTSRGLCTAAQAPHVIEHLRSERLVDDRRFAANRALFRQEAGYGPHRIRAELRELGIEESDADEAIRSCLDSGFSDQAAGQAERLLPGLLHRPDSRALLGRRLRGRGFGERHIRHALAVLSERYPHWGRRSGQDARRGREQHE